LGKKVFAVTTYHKSVNEATEAAEEWKREEICAIGWSFVKNLCSCRSEEEVRERLKEHGGGFGGKDVWNFVGVMEENDLVLAYSRHNTISYVGEVRGPCRFNTRNVVGDLDGRFRYPHQRKVYWWDEPHHFDRYDLPEFYAAQFGKKGITVRQIDLGSKSFEEFVRLLRACASSSSKFPGINEDAVKAGLLKHLHHSLDNLEKGLILNSAEAAIGKQKESRPDFVAQDEDGRIVLIECKGTAVESTVEQILSYGKEYGEARSPRLMIVAFRISESCRMAARKAKNIELVECDLIFNKI